MTMTSTRGVEPSLALPARRLAATALLAPAVAGGGVALVAQVLDHAALRVAAAPGAGLVAAVVLASLLAIAPHRVRLLGDWMNWWLGGITARLLVTPLLTLLLYSATSLDATALGLSVCIPFLVTVLAEAAVLARSLNHQMDGAADAGAPE